MTYKIVFTPTARVMLEAIRDRRARRSIQSRIDRLTQEPEKQGKPLMGPLAGFYSTRVGQRYRVIYQVDRGNIVVIVVAVGIRKEKDEKDIYALAQKLIRLRLFQP